MYETIYFAASFPAGTQSKALHSCYSAVELATGRLFRGSPWFATVKPAHRSSFRYSRGEPVNYGQYMCKYDR